MRNAWVTARHKELEGQTISQWSVDTNSKNTWYIVCCVLYVMSSRYSSVSPRKWRFVWCLYGHIYYCKRLLGSTNLSKISSNSMSSGPFASNHTSKDSYSLRAPAWLNSSMGKMVCGSVVDGFRYSHPTRLRMWCIVDWVIVTFCSRRLLYYRKKVTMIHFTTVK